MSRRFIVHTCSKRLAETPFSTAFSCMPWHRHKRCRTNLQLPINKQDSKDNEKGRSELSHLLNSDLILFFSYNGETLWLFCCFFALHKCFLFVGQIVATEYFP